MQRENLALDAVVINLGYNRYGELAWDVYDLKADSGVERKIAGHSTIGRSIQIASNLLRTYISRGDLIVLTSIPGRLYGKEGNVQGTLYQENLEKIGTRLRSRLDNGKSLVVCSSKVH